MTKSPNSWSYCALVVFSGGRHQVHWVLHFKCISACFLYFKVAAPNRPSVEQLCHSIRKRHVCMFLLQSLNKATLLLYMQVHVLKFASHEDARAIQPVCARQHVDHGTSRSCCFSCR